MLELAFILVGILAGLIGGVIGLAGGIVIIPILVIFFHFSQKMAQGTTLALLLPPITLLGAWVYYKHGNVDVRAAIFLALGFFIGNYSGSILSQYVSNGVSTKIFGIVLAAVAIRLLLS